jgi:hypothetical protein
MHRITRKACADPLMVLQAFSMHLRICAYSADSAHTAMSKNASAVMASICDRVRRLVSVPVSDTEAMNICFLCATVESDALLELSHSRVVRAEAHSHCKELAITAYEFNALLGDEALTQSQKHALSMALQTDELDPERQRYRACMESALKLTLAENAQREMWEASPRVRERVALALLRKQDHVACIHQALGEVLRSDLRRIDDLRAETEEIGIDIMSVSSLITTVCTHHVK